MAAPTRRPFRLARRALRVGLPVGLLFAATSSAARLDTFVASGEYAHAVALARDCRARFIPALLPSDRAAYDAATHPQGLARFVSFRASGAELAYLYRQADVAAGHYRVSAPDEYPMLGMGPDARLEHYEVADFSRGGVSVASVASAAGCARILLYAKPIHPLGLRKTTVITRPDGVLQFARPLRPRATGQVTIAAIDPETLIDTLTLVAYADGVPAPGQRLQVHTDARGIPGEVGATLAHEHLFVSGGYAAPTLKFVGRSPTAVVPVTTGEGGVAKLPFVAGYRGGAEAFIADGTINGVQASVARAVVIRYKKMEHFTQAFGYSAMTGNPTPSTAFPFLMTGNRNNEGKLGRHYYNHWIQAGRARAIHDMFLRIWQLDKRRAADTQRTGDQHWFVMNDMSLEYGGAFKIGDGNTCTDPNTGAHASHNVGLDFDVNPCYSYGRTGQSVHRGPDCEQHPEWLRIDEAVLAAQVIGDQNGAILLHLRTDRFPAPHHYHIRLSPIDDKTDTPDPNGEGGR